MIKLIVTLTVISYFFQLTTACSCLPHDDKITFCESKFVGIVNVLHRERCPVETEVDVCYRIKVENQIRGLRINPTWLKTAYHSAACGVELHFGKTYMMMTNDTNQSNMIGLYLCDIWEDWTSRQHRLERELYYNRVTMGCPGLKSG